MKKSNASDSCVRLDAASKTHLMRTWKQVQVGLKDTLLHGFVFQSLYD